MPENGTSLNSLFAQRSNVFSPRFWSLLSGIVRFNKAAKLTLAAGNLDERMTLGQFLDKNAITGAVVSHYIAPMTAAIWSTPLGDVRTFPLAFFLRFCANHGLFDLSNRPQWYVIKGGSHAYVNALLGKLKAEVLTGNPVQQVTRQADGVTVQFADGSTRCFDELIFACHSDEALAMLGDPTPFEKSILSAIAYQENEVILHTDARLLPRAKRAWAAWNYLLPVTDSGLPTVTYNMNMLQKIDAPETFCVSLNRSMDIAPEQILGRYRYAHPQFTAQATRAQQRHSEISGVNHSHYCGAYWRYGFHEDGVASALRVCQTFGISL